MAHSESHRFLFSANIPRSGFLALPSFVDLSVAKLLEQAFSGRQITWLIEDKASIPDDLNHYLEQGKQGVAFSVHDPDLQQVGKSLQTYLENNSILVFVPTQSVALAKTPIRIQTIELKSICEMGLPLLPIVVDVASDSQLWLEQQSKDVGYCLAFGDLLKGKQASIACYQEAMYRLAESCYSDRNVLKTSLAEALLLSLKHHGNQYALFDGTDDSELKFGSLLAAALAFAQFLKKETRKERVAIILPPGKGGLIANLAVVLAGKVPVNINFTASQYAVKSAMRQAEVDCYVTADPFIRKNTEFPWPPMRDLILIERLLPKLKSSMMLWGITAKVLPVFILKIILGLNKIKAEDEAALLFTSGSSGEPKGVPLSNRNLLANVCQFGSRLNLGKQGSILGALPLFHSFGFTVTLWYPLLAGINLITFPSPLEVKRLAELISLKRVKVLLSTPTFLRAFIKRIESEQLASLEYVITGAEKLPDALAQAFHKKFNILPQQGYGLTETSPATNVNLPSPLGSAQVVSISSTKDGSVGKLLPGVAIKILDPVTDKPLPINQSGIIWLKGSNIFQGYLKQPTLTEKILVDKWFCTGDVGRVDEDGFLWIEGRISRFSKIGGEMVPHETVETYINNVFELNQETERKIVILGMPDEQKGEAIVLLSTIAGPALEQETIALRYKLLELGISPLWCPKKIIRVEEIPVLASGKLDIKACQAIVEQHIHG